MYALILIACSPELEFSPSYGSARGGDTVVVTGTRIPRDPQLFFAGERAEVLDRSLRRAEVLTPRWIAGLVPVSLERLGKPEGFFLYQPLELLFEPSAEWYLPTLTGVQDALVYDLDGDGVLELVTVAEGAVAIWRNTGFGELEAAPDPGFGPTVVAIAANQDTLFVCSSDRGPRRMGWDGSNYVIEESPPAEPGCLDAWWVPFEGGAWVERRADGLRLWRDAERWPEASSVDGDCPVTLGECTVSEGIATMSSARLEVQLPEGATALSIRHEGALIVTIEGQEVNPAGASWSTWTTQVEGVSSLTIDAKTARIDHLVAWFGDHDSVLLQDFQTYPLDVPYAGSPARIDGGLAVGGANGIELFDAALELVPGRFSGECITNDLEALDVDGDGQEELFAACEGQDRLFRADGEGFWFEDSAASLPVDDVAGGEVSEADLDRDGLPELLVPSIGAVDRLYHGTGDGFEDWSARTPLQVQDTLALLPDDVDADGDLDLIVVRTDGLSLWVMTGD